MLVIVVSIGFNHCILDIKLKYSVTLTACHIFILNSLQRREIGAAAIPRDRAIGCPHSRQSLKHLIGGKTSGYVGRLSLLPIISSGTCVSPLCCWSSSH